MKRKIGPMLKNSKMLMFILPLTALLLCWAAYEHLYLNIRAKQENLEEVRFQKEKILQKYTTVIAHKQQISSALPFLRPIRAISAEGILKGSDPSKARESLESLIEEIVSGKDGAISDQKPVESTQTGPFTHIVSEVEADLPDAKSLQDIIYAIETHPVYMVIQHMDIQAKDKENPQALSVQLRIAALWGGL
ncbi:MAG: GspMb/PilO family protein [Smithellaceae bacterium]